MVDSMYHSRFSTPLEREIKVSWMFADMVCYRPFWQSSVYPSYNTSTNEDFRA